MKTKTTPKARAIRRPSRTRKVTRRPRRLALWFAILLIGFAAFWMGLHLHEFFQLVADGVRADPKRLIDFIAEGVVPLIQRLLKARFIAEWRAILS